MAADRNGTPGALAGVRLSLEGTYDTRAFVVTGGFCCHGNNDRVGTFDPNTQLNRRISYTAGTSNHDSVGRGTTAGRQTRAVSRSGFIGAWIRNPTTLHGDPVMRSARILVLIVGTLALPAAAQDTVVVFVDHGLDASSRTARRAVSIFNASRTTRFFGDAAISRNRRIEGDVGVLNGPLTIGGVVEGDVIALNADIILRDDAVVRGDITVFGGEIFGLSDATVRGNTRAYTSSIQVTRVGRRVRLRDDPQRARRISRVRSARRRQGDFTIVVGANTYNRVEGLPLHVGPRVRFPLSELGWLTLEGLGILRTAGDLDENRQDLGYDGRAELDFGRSTDVRLGIRAFDVVAPVEAWKLGDEEIGLASLLWHRDYRDYFLRRGVAGYLKIKPNRELTLTAEYARNEDESVAARDPWTPFRNDRLWRVNPPVDEGTFTTFSGRVQYDERHWGSGWYLAAEWERGSSDSVSAVALPASIRGPIPASNYTYDRAVIDIRRYERVGGRGLFALRAYGAGTVGNDPLPVQRRLSLGGIEPMPGFAFRRFACNEQIFLPGNPALCDRVFLVQAEYRGDLSFSSPWVDDRDRRRRREMKRVDDDVFDWDDWFWFDGPSFVFFANAGTAWIDDDGPGALETDVGAGLTFGGIGIYGAKAVSEDGSIRIILRLNNRF